MCHASCIVFGFKNMKPDEIKGKRIAEIGSYDVNGSLREIIKSYEPAAWVGVDLTPCNHTYHDTCVTDICDAENLIERFGRDSFDFVITTEMMEHVKDWRKIIHNLKGILKPGCPLLLTTRSPGFRLHNYPTDYWRYTVDDMRHIFADCEIQQLESDPLAPGVFVRVVKPLNFVEKDLSNYNVQAMLQRPVKVAKLATRKKGKR